jgi:hypothetical protein
MGQDAQQGAERREAHLQEGEGPKWPEAWQPEGLLAHLGVLAHPERGVERYPGVGQTQEGSATDPLVLPGLPVHLARVPWVQGREAYLAGAGSWTDRWVHLVQVELHRVGHLVRAELQ